MKKMDEKTEVLVERLKLHSRTLMWMPLGYGIFIIASGFWLIPMDGLVYFQWAGIVIGIEIIRVLHSLRIMKNFPGIEPSKAYREQNILGIASGTAIGMMAPLFLHMLDAAAQTLLLSMLLAMPALAIHVAAASPSVAGTYAFSALVPVTMASSAIYPQHSPVPAIGILLYVAIIVVASVESEKTLAKSIAIRRQRDQVVHELENSNIEARQAMRRAEGEAQARSRVLAAASHDLRQPLHALSVYGAVLASSPDRRVITEVGGHIAQIVQSLGDLLHGLLDLSRLSTGSYVSAHRDFELDELIAQVCNEFRPRALSRHLAFICEAAPLSMTGDALAVTRIARNLIDNAIKYTEHGTVRVSLNLVDGWAQLSVSDTGKGISPDAQAHVFEEFFQVDNPSRDREKGIGLGLAIVDRLVKLMHARIELHSSSGAGTCVNVFLPGVVQTPRRPLATRATPAALPGHAVYLVDDEKTVLHSTAELLAHWQLAVKTAGTGQQAHALFETAGSPDLLIVDLRLGEAFDGVALARCLQEKFGDFEVLFITGETSLEGLREARSSGWPLLQKPVEAAVLHQAIAQALTRRVGHR